MSQANSTAARYARHYSLPPIGPKGQEKLGDSSILIIGAGGLGATASLYLTTAGIGRIFINDFDRVDETNLPRQILFRPDDIGRHKAEAAAQSLREWNPEATIIPLPERLSPHALSTTIREVDVVLDCSDNFATRWQVNKTCFKEKRALVSGAAIRMEGQLALFRHDRPGGPCYRCLYSESDENLEDCAGQGILAPVAGTIGCMMATETIKLLTGIDSDLEGACWVYDAASGSSRIVSIKKSPDCPVCGDAK
jgi:molybdopterin/thiamine biosynthesis adenylyltransferase